MKLLRIEVSLTGQVTGGNQLKALQIILNNSISNPLNCGSFK
jgi:hypothetical protein